MRNTSIGRWFGACVVCVGASVAATAAAPQDAADLILFDGKLFTGDAAHPTAEAVAIRGQRIVALGTSKEIVALANGNTRRIDLKGRLVTPGFNDAHMHFGAQPQGVNLEFGSLEPSWDETKAAIAAATARAPPGTWIFGSVGSTVVMNEDVTRFELDRLAPEHPLILAAYYGHGYVFNGKAMALLGIDKLQADPMGGYFERVAGSKRINGRAWEYAQWRANRTLIDRVSDADQIAALRAWADQAAAFGITSAQVFPGTSIGHFVRMLDAAQLPIRVRAMALSLTTPEGRDLSEIRGLAKLRSTEPNVTVSGIKWILDGTPFERGAALRRPYGDRPDWRGRLNFPETEVPAMLHESLELDQPLLLHCVGDRTVEVVFDAMDAAKVDWPAKRVRLEHGDGVIADLIPRARKLGVIVVQNPSHFADADLFRQRWGTDMQRLRSLIDAGIPVALGSDGPMNPFLNILFATTHPAAPAEAITREQAVLAYTYGSAFAEFAEHDKGTLAVGKLADLVVLSQDIFAVPGPELPKTHSVLTLVGGKVVYDANELN
jgi:predicted amidohydrolase YtcJ